MDKRLNSPYPAILPTKMIENGHHCHSGSLQAYVHVSKSQGLGDVQLTMDQLGSSVCKSQIGDNYLE